MMRLFDVESKLFNSNRFETAYKCRGLFNIVFSKGCCAQIPRYNRGGIKRHQVILSEELRQWGWLSILKCLFMISPEYTAVKTARTGKYR